MKSATATKPPRKPAESRGLTLRLGVETSDKLRELASMAGATKDALEDRLSAWVEANLGAFRNELANEARAKVHSLLAEEKGDVAS